MNRRSEGMKQGSVRSAGYSDDLNHPVSEGSLPGLDRKVLAAVERLGRALRAARQEVATRWGISILGLVVVETLADHRARRVGELAVELDVSQPTVSEAVSALERRGLLARHRDPKDLRSTRVTLTERGSSVAAEIAAELQPILGGESGSTAARATALRVLLGEITRLQTAGVITVNRCCLTCSHYEPPSSRRQAQCLLLGTTLRDQDLRVDCAEHEAAG